MKTFPFIFIIFLISLFFSSCAKDFYISYDNNADKPGTLHLIPTSPTANTFITLNDSLILERAFVKSVQISNISEGIYHLHYASANDKYGEKLDHQEKFFINSNEEMTRIIVVPPASSGYWQYMGLYLISVALLLLIF